MSNGCCKPIIAITEALIGVFERVQGIQQVLFSGADGVHQKEPFTLRNCQTGRALGDALAQGIELICPASVGIGVFLEPS